MAYARKIYIGNQNYTTRVNQCDFQWDRDGGAVSANLVIESAAFDSYEGIEIGDVVEIRYSSSSSSRWWKGIVADLRTRLDAGLTISCVGGRVKLGEVFPLGRFGTQVDVAAPSGLASLVTEVGGELAAGIYTYQVSTVDEDGETVCCANVTGTVVGDEGQVDLSWDAVEGATGYRVYRGTANPFTYWDTSEITFNDDGTSSGTSIAALPASDTATAPTIASAYVDDVVTHLLTTYLPSGMTVGDVTAGGDMQLDDYDLGDGSASLADVLDALADIVGDTVWGVDADWEVYFVPEADAVDYTFRVGVEGAEENIVFSAERLRSRDGVTAVRVVGEDELNDPTNEDVQAARISDTEDWPAPKSVLGRGWYKGTNYRFATNITSASVEIPESTSFFTTAYSGSVVTAIALVPELTAIKRAAFEWNGSSYDIRPPYTTAIIERQLAAINKRMRTAKDLKGRNVAEYENMTRRKPVARYLPGVKTPALSKIAATNFTIKYTPVPDRWSITIENITNLIIPGVHMVRLYTQFGDRYDLVVQSASYVFEDTAVVTLTCGDPEYDEDKEVEDNKKVIQRMASRTFQSNKWSPYV